MIKISDALLDEIRGLLRCITTGTSLSGEAKGKAEVVLSLLSGEKLVDFGGGIFFAEGVVAQERYKKSQEEINKVIRKINESIETTSAGWPHFEEEQEARQPNIGYIASQVSLLIGEVEKLKNGKASQRDFAQLWGKVERLKENRATRREFREFKHGTEMQIERLKHVISTLEDKVGGRCYATINAETPNRACEKCGSKDLRMVWIGKETIMPNMAPAGREYMLFTCNVCAYSWEGPYAPDQLSEEQLKRGRDKLDCALGRKTKIHSGLLGIRTLRTPGVVAMTDEELHRELDNEIITIKLYRKELLGGGFFKIGDV